MSVPQIPHPSAQWKVHAAVQKWKAGDVEITYDETGHKIVTPKRRPYETVEKAGNLLMYVGASALWQRLIGTGVSAFSNANAYIGVGDSTTPAVATQTDLIASSNKLREAMDATYPIHSAGSAAANASIVYKSTFETGDANFAWNEWAIFNASSSGEMLNRKVASFGTKTSSDTWSLTITLTLS